jgi:hypothetical protein
MTPYSFVNNYQRFEGTYYGNLMGRYPEEGRQVSSFEKLIPVKTHGILSLKTVMLIQS